MTVTGVRADTATHLTDLKAQLRATTTVTTGRAGAPGTRKWYPRGAASLRVLAMVGRKARLGGPFVRSG
jgi:hypothetical protein